MSHLISFVGIAVLILIAILASNNRSKINVRTVVGAFLIQLIFGGFVLYVPQGAAALNAFASGVHQVINYSEAGLSFLFGGLRNNSQIGFVFALMVLPTIIFFASLISVLYYIGVMGWVIKGIGGGIRFVLGTSRTESLSAAANIFVGQTEAPLLIKPFLSTLTKSELFAVMTGGLASVAGSVLAGYAAMGVPLNYLIAASFMAAPGGLLFAKLIYPEDIEGAADRDTSDIKDLEEGPKNIIDAAAAGASDGLFLALNVGAMLVAFVSLIALINGIIGGVAGFFGYQDITLEFILGYILKPLAFLIGADWNDSGAIGSLIGIKVIANEFVGYLQLTGLMAPGADGAAAVLTNHKSIAIATFALCGFANFSSIAILVGGLGSLAPKRRSEIAQFGLKAVLAGTLSNLTSAAIAGFFIGISG